MATTKSQETETDLLQLQNQLVVARNEIHNLRQQIRTLGCTQQKEVERIKNALDSGQCLNCRCIATGSSQSNSDIPPDIVPMRAIGVVSTWFPEKKGTPRQPSVCMSSQGKLCLFNSVFTNPEHALEGLESFSHMWILFHFHKNDCTHVRAKVSPPRLNGARTGVFGTRSPHRPSPIGMSLVSIDRVEGTTVYFSGVDMVDGTPVLDIKPYIPQYDNPVHCESPVNTPAVAVPMLRLMDGGEAENACGGQGDVGDLSASLVEALSMQQSSGKMGEREAPDGEEGACSALATPIGAYNTSANDRPSISPSTQVRVPAWILQPPVSKLTVVISDRARAQLDSITKDSEDVESPIGAITSVLQDDPRSIYLRERWGNQFFTFLICNLHVSCKFDDSAHTVQVFQVRSAGKMCECGQPEWQCSVHSKPAQ